MKNQLFNELLDLKTLRIGWHLTRRSLRGVFVENNFYTEVFSSQLDQNLDEIRKRLKNNEYQFHDCIKTEIPKKGLGVRPGVTISIQDSIVLYAIIFLISDKLNKNLSPSVYSYRLKEDVITGKFNKQHALFKDSSALELPFLKKSTIYKRFLKYDEWYITWVDYDLQTKQIIAENEFKFMATSDISAYFENIQLSLLKEHLKQFFPEEPKLINLLFKGLLFWTERTSDDDVLARGLAQGNDIFSFLGNFFLKPIDDFFDNHPQRESFKYFRYMDDIKIFTKDEILGKKLLLDLNRELRKLHLNTQSAKTKVYSQYPEKEISRMFIDSRLEYLSIWDQKFGKNLDKLTKQEKKEASIKLEKIISRNSSDGQSSITKHKRPLEELSFRLFLRYITCSCAVQNPKCIIKFFNELNKNLDVKLLQKLTSITRTFHSYSTLEKRIFNFMESKQLLIPYQKALCIKALRYIDSISLTGIETIFALLINQKEDFYIRLQCCLLLSTVSLTDEQIRKIENLWDKEENIQIKIAISFLLTQRHDISILLEKLIYYPNLDLNLTALFFKSLITNEAYVKTIIRNVFSNLSDNLGIVHGISLSNSLNILLTLSKYTNTKFRKKIKNTRIKNIIKTVNTKLQKKIKELKQNKAG